MRAALRITVMLAVTVLAIAVVQDAASAATAIEYGLVAALIP
ncbi:hypothetical protein [Nonomuraea candida]|nr:hypothetical protein [Nonomuraea candida]